MQNDVISYFMQLISIDSESLNERAMIDTLKQDLQELGAQVDEDDCHHKTGGNAGSLFAYLPGAIDKAPILLCAHVDTVKPGNGIKARIENGVIYSDGTTILGSDDKSGVAEIMIALKRIKESGKAHAPIEILFTVSEEIGLLGAKNFDKSRLTAAFGYALDSHRVGELLIGAPAQNSLKITIFGKEAHAGVEPEKGLNAIRVAAEAISAMPLGRIDFETTCNIGKIQGGEATNIVPNKVTLHGEARSHNPAKLERVCSDIRYAFESTVARYAEHGAKLEYSCTTEYNSFKVKEDDPVVKLAAKALRKLDIPIQTVVGGGGSDANIISATGLPMIITGTGMDKVHTVHENIETDQLLKGTSFIEELVLTYSAE
jgi:tripeptide aminopeptidase